MERSLNHVVSAGRNLFLSIAGNFGYPAALFQLIKTQPGIRVEIEAPCTNAAVESVVNWHEWGHPYGELKGWVKQADFYGGTVIRRDEFLKIGTREVTDQWSCDISEIDGLFDSRSMLTNYQDLDAFVEQESPGYIDTLSLARLRENLSHGGIGILKDNTSDYFAYHNWDGRLFLINHDGSHHFAAARYIAQRIEEPVPLQGKLYHYGINGQAIKDLRRDFEIFVIGASEVFNLEFNDAMNHYRADYYYADLPRPYTDLQAIFLPHQKERSARVAEILRDEGFFNLGQYLQDLSIRGLRNNP
ncbi:MAG: DUF6685 family protein [Candidatus Thiodiazotropha endolucinida]